MITIQQDQCLGYAVWPVYQCYREYYSSIPPFTWSRFSLTVNRQHRKKPTSNVRNSVAKFMRWDMIWNEKTDYRTFADSVVWTNLVKNIKIKVASAMQFLQGFLEYWNSSRTLQGSNTSVGASM